MIVDVLYHWAPQERRQSILQHGLQIGSENTVNTSGPVNHVCFGTSPRRAWALSGETLEKSLSWDLYEIQVGRTDRLEVLTEWGNSVSEVRIRNNIPPDRIWLVSDKTHLEKRLEYHA